MAKHDYSAYKEYYRLRRLKQAKEREEALRLKYPEPEWKNIPGYQSYLINRGGVIINKFGRVMKPGVHLVNGYRHVLLVGEDKKSHHVYVHKAVWMTFKGDTTPGMKICHLDADPANNCIDNLKEMTVKENLNKEVTAKRRNRNRIEKGVVAYKRLVTYKYDKHLNLVKTYPSVKKVTEDGHSISSVSMCCSGKQRTHQGFIFSHTKIRRKRK